MRGTYVNSTMIGIMSPDAIVNDLYWVTSDIKMKRSEGVRKS
jgi:hypothetical protein